MSNSLKIVALTALAFVAAGSVAEAAPQQHGKHQFKGSAPQNHNVVRPHHTSSAAGKPSSGSHKVVISHCDPLPCKGTSHPKPGKDTNVVHHHKPDHWHHHHHRHHEWRYAYSYYKPYGYRDYSYERPSYTTASPQPSYATYSPPPAAPAASCLTKEYLKDGPVLFKDTCTKEWAIGDAAEAQSVNASCLRKEYVAGGKVKFSDVCTKEWAMNPPADAKPNPQRPPQQASTEEDDDEEN